MTGPRTDEIEHKYDVPDGFALPDLGAGPPREYLLRAVYHDTPGLRLAAHRVTLRRREGGTDEGWHLKLPTVGESRAEIHAPLADDVPPEILGLVAAFTRGEDLTASATLTTRRVLREVTADDGAVLAEIADDTVTATRGTRTETWREIEAELKDGPRALLDTIGERLREAGARPAATASKLARALGPDLPRRRAAGREGGAGAAVTAYLARQLDAILLHDPLARRAEFDAVHRMRVAVRRVRSLLRSARPVLARAHTDELRGELAWLAGELGEVRDLEVLRMRFTAHLDGLGLPRPRLLDDLAASEAAAYGRLNRTLSRRRYFAVLDGLDALVALPPFTGRAKRAADDELPRLLSRVARRLITAHDEILVAEDPAAQRHETRKLAKQLRYAAEAAKPVLGKRAARVAKAATEVQETFGGAQDGVIAMEHLRGAQAGAGDAGEAFTLGVLYGLEVREHEDRAAMDAAWAGLLEALD
ncbi:CHAD domain-containing protein [Actinorhabdospora filicis]|uniref:CHAD domain-containing protein n=1 Tax=Actinorhabdospora filicis TaxID=1785913 RepID=A0A9W6SLA8_9ACTN|nr:CYTH and CHAD domain-containing protein [Actinorhabdospora filicis]GLZ79060.1 CHAD domain-containing protein [Actinorhabdospora filicis]